MATIIRASGRTYFASLDYEILLNILTDDEVERYIEFDVHQAINGILSEETQIIAIKTSSIESIKDFVIDPVYGEPVYIESAED